MGRRDLDARRPRPPAGIDRAPHRRAGTDEIVDDDDEPSGNVAGKQRAAHDAPDALLVHERETDGPSERSLQQRLKMPRPLRAADVRSGDRELMAGGLAHEVVDEQRRRIHMHGLAAKGVVECRRIVHLQRHHAVHAHCLEQLRNVACRHRIPSLRVPVLACVGQVRYAGSHTSCARILQGADEEEHRTQPVVRRPQRIAEQALDEVNRTSAHFNERPHHLFAAVEYLLLMSAERHTQRRTNGRAEGRRRRRREHTHGMPERPCGRPAVV